MSSILLKLRVGLLGFIFTAIGFGLYLCAVILNLLSYGIPLLSEPAIWCAWFAGLPLTIGITALLFEIFCISKLRKDKCSQPLSYLDSKQATVVLTAYNDELSIAKSVLDFFESPFVNRVIVIDNNSEDSTVCQALSAGAQVIIEQSPGYGRCVYRALLEGSKFLDTQFVILCEGDMTFRALDIEKLMSYRNHATVVNGTRIVEQLRENETQLSSFMFFGNFAAAKILELKHLGRGTVTDLGTTYKLARSEFLRKNLDLFDSSINLEFNAHFLDTLLENKISFVEVPITFHPRVGVSKGGNTSNLRALKVGLNMLLGITFGWKFVKRN